MNSLLYRRVEMQFLLNNFKKDLKILNWKYFGLLECTFLLSDPNKLKDYLWEIPCNNYHVMKLILLLKAKLFYGTKAIRMFPIARPDTISKQQL